MLSDVKGLKFLNVKLYGNQLNDLIYETQISHDW